MTPGLWYSFASTTTIPSEGMVTILVGDLYRIVAFVKATYSGHQIVVHDKTVPDDAKIAIRMVKNGEGVTRCEFAVAWEKESGDASSLTPTATIADETGFVADQVSVSTGGRLLCIVGDVALLPTGGGGGEGGDGEWKKLFRPHFNENGELESIEALAGFWSAEWISAGGKNDEQIVMTGLTWESLGTTEEEKKIGSEFLDLPVASATEAGVVKIGSGLEVHNGVISVPDDTGDGNVSASVDLTNNRIVLGGGNKSVKTSSYSIFSGSLDDASSSTLSNSVPTTSAIKDYVDAHSGGGGTGDGTVKSVGLTMPSQFSVSGSPVTGSGTLAVTLKSTYGIPTITQIALWDKICALFDVDTANNAVYVKDNKGFYSDSFVSAGGVNSSSDSGSGSGGGTMELVPATEDTLGGVMVGAGLSADADGTLNVFYGSGLGLDSRGRLYATGGGSSSPVDIVTSLSSSNTDSQVPSARLMYSLLGDLESTLASINSTLNSLL